MKRELLKMIIALFIEITIILGVIAYIASKNGIELATPLLESIFR